MPGIESLLFNPCCEDSEVEEAATYLTCLVLSLVL